jgi:hypothetical protein
MYGRVVLVTLMGVAISHSMRAVIHQLKLFEKEITRQVISMFLLTIIFSIAYIGLWIMVFFVFDLENAYEKQLSNFGKFYWLPMDFL